MDYHKQINKYPEEEVKDITEVYGIHPTLNKLTGATRTGLHFLIKFKKRNDKKSKKI